MVDLQAADDVRHRCEFFIAMWAVSAAIPGISNERRARAHQAMNQAVGVWCWLSNMNRDWEMN